MTIGNLIKNYRKTHGLSKRELAESVGVSPAYIGILEKGVNPTTKSPVSPTARILVALSRAMGIPLDVLTTQEGSTPTEAAPPTDIALILRNIADVLSALPPETRATLAQKMAG